VRSRRTAEDFLRNPETHLEAFRFREERLLDTVARRLKSRLDSGMDSFQAMNECQDHLVTLARAHVERTALESFREGVARAPLPGLSEVLGNLAELWALSRLEADRGWFLEAGYMESSQTRAIRAQVNLLCREIREQALPWWTPSGSPTTCWRRRRPCDGAEPDGTGLTGRPRGRRPARPPWSYEPPRPLPATSRDC
jgi:acyl-CoA oxidase